MAIKKVSEYKKQILSDTTKSGNEYEIVYEKTGDTSEVRITQVNNAEDQTKLDDVKIEVELIHDISDEIRALEGRPVGPQSFGGYPSAVSGPIEPEIVDHRDDDIPPHNELSPEEIQEKADDAMQRLDPTAKAAVSFTPQEPVLEGSKDASEEVSPDDLV